jgi:nucleoside-diphosphate-sugar epimerase
MRTVIVTGGAGVVGRRVAGLLVAGRHADRVVAIDAREWTDRPKGVEACRLDLAEEGDGVAGRLDEIFAGADAVLHLAWQTSDEGPKARAQIQRASATNRLALARVLAAAGRAGVESVVHLSSATVYGAWPDNAVPLSEESPLRPNPELAFAVGKADAERVVAGWSEEHPEVAVAILRPAAVVGSMTQPLYRALTGTAVAKEDDGPRRVQFLHVDDLASAVVLALTARLRGAYNVAPDSGTAEDTARALAGGLAKMRLPGRIATLVASWGWELARSGAPKATRPYRLHPWVVAPDRIKAAGWVPSYSSEEALVDADQRGHWDDLPPGKRQNYTVLAVIGSAVAATAGLVGAGAVVYSRRRAVKQASGIWSGYRKRRP